MKLVLVCHRYGVRLDDPCCYPLGFMYISSVLKSQGHAVKVLNYNLWEYDFREEIQGCDAVLFTGFEEFLPYIIRDAAICRELGIRTILGGALATFAPHEMLQHVDTVITGEGEAVVSHALSSCGIIHGTRPDLDDLPLPDYEGFGIQEYRRRHGINYMGVLTSRGCPYSCLFCAHTCSFQMRKLAAVFDEIAHYREVYGVTTIVFNDNTLNLSKKRFMDICTGMKELGMGWTAAIRVDIFDEQMAIAFKESGGTYFIVGIESFNQGKLDAMQKHTTTNQIIVTLDLLKKYDIKYHGHVLLGLPGEKYTDIVAELEAIPRGYNVFPVLVQPFIGTSYRQRDISEEQTGILNDAFLQFAQSRGMCCYPTV